MNARLTLPAILFALVATGASAAQRPADPDWPCQQPLVPMIGAATVWSGPPLDGNGDWRSVPEVAGLVQRIAPRSVGAEDGEKAIAEFTRALQGEDRARLVTLAFVGLLDETNSERSMLIARIKDLTQRQRKLADLVARTNAELDQIPPDAEGDAAARRADLQQRRTFTTRTFAEVQRTMRYACEAPAQLDSRLGAYARALQAALS